MAGKRTWLTAWIPHRLELLMSPPWRLAPRPLRKMLERIEIEHLRHGGYNNGSLYVAYSQFVEAGISRRMVKPTIELGVRLGLLEVRQEGGRDIRHPNAYRLTYVPAKGKTAPSDEWKAVTEARAAALVEAFKSSERRTAKTARTEAA